MAEEFFQQLIDCMIREGIRHPGHIVSPGVFKTFMADAARPAPVPEALPEERNVAGSIRTPAAAVVERAADPAAPSPQDTESVPLAAVGSLGELCSIVQGCRNCRLCERRRNVVFGEGNPEARLMFIGEGPGEQEDIQGRPFVGPAGQLLTKMIQAMQFTREEVYIANVVKCRPPGNRNPEPDEADACMDYLKRQIALIKPEVIVLLGAVAARFLLHRQEGIRRLRGRWMGFEGIPVMPTYHPSYLLRAPGEKRDAWADLQQVMKVFGKVYQPRG